MPAIVMAAPLKLCALPAKVVKVEALLLKLLVKV